MMEKARKDEAKQAKKLWLKAKKGGSLTLEEKTLMRMSYYSCTLPHDDVFNVYQWVEDGFPWL